MNTEDAIQAAVDRIVHGYNLALEKAVSAARSEAHRSGMLAGLKEAVGLAYNRPHFVQGLDADEHGQLRPGSPYDRGRYDAQAAIRARISALDTDGTK